jgi:hypothetical protein
MKVHIFFIRQDFFMRKRVKMALLVVFCLILTSACQIPFLGKPQSEPSFEELFAKALEHNDQIDQFKMDTTASLTIQIDSPQLAELPFEIPNSYTVLMSGSSFGKDQKAQLDFSLDLSAIFAAVEQALEMYLQYSASQDSPQIKMSPPPGRAPAVPANLDEVWQLLGIPPLGKEMFSQIDFSMIFDAEAFYLQSSQWLGEDWYTIFFAELNALYADVGMTIDFAELFALMSDNANSLAIQEMYQDALLDVVEQDPQMVGDMSTRVFTVKLDYQALSENVGEQFGADFGLDQTLKEQMLDQSNQPDLEYTVKFWLGQEDGLIYQMDMTMQQVWQEDDFEIIILGEANYLYDYNSPEIIIEIPEAAIDFKDFDFKRLPEDSLVRILGQIFFLKNLQSAEIKSRDAKRKADLFMLRTALELYYDENMTYPVVETYANLADYLVPEYVRTLPDDPSVFSNYHYQSLQEGQSYELGCWLEDKQEFFYLMSAWNNNIPKLTESIKDKPSPFDYNNSLDMNTDTTGIGGEPNQASIGPVATAQQKSRDARRKADLASVRTALELYYDDNMVYPVVGSYDELVNHLVPDYVQQLPTDPSPAGKYLYKFGADGQTYVAGCWLEAVKEFYSIKSFNVTKDNPGDYLQTGEYPF